MSLIKIVTAIVMAIASVVTVPAICIAIVYSQCVYADQPLSFRLFGYEISSFGPHIWRNGEARDDRIFYLQYVGVAVGENSCAFPGWMRFCYEHSRHPASDEQVADWTAKFGAPPPVEKVPDELRRVDL